MKFNIGETLRVDGEVFRVAGKVVYKSHNDAGSVWTEYCLHSQSNGKEKWLSIDEVYREYSISEVIQGGVYTAGYHVVDEGVEEVVSVEGRTDVDLGECASFLEYEDSTEEKIISVERWEDGEEISVGYYLDWNEIERIGTQSQSTYSNYSTYYPSGAGVERNRKVNKSWISIVACIAVFMGFLGIKNCSFQSKDDIAKYLKNATMYDYETSITGEEDEKADVYVTQYSVDQAVRDIIEGIEGQTEDIERNEETEDDSVAILTKYEYCMVYTSEEGQTLVQVSSRRYTYRSDRDLYRARRHTNRYYRRYYYSRGYSSDTKTYRKYTSPYSTYSDSSLGMDFDSEYDTYSSSVRQSSRTSRSSSGGGLSSGK